jgi:class 3 adenylate cyclase/tetratricopeptide (TPR) repeat protein
MRCSKCGSDSPAGKKFCGDCGASLANLCPKCGADNPSSKRFCGDCGAVLVTGIATAQSPRSPLSRGEIAIIAEATDSAVVEGERKTVTALFADIKGSTEMMESLDPEQARAIVDPALKLMIEAVHRYDGYVVQSTGDGIFALFGAPVAHEDHSQRALYAALRMHEDLRRYSAKLVGDGGSPIQGRIGINTGEVVVRMLETERGHAEYTPIGHSTNLAARMQTAAPVGSIAVTDATRRLCEGYFTLRALGVTRVKGLSEPINVYEVTGLGPLRTRLQRAAARGLTKFVGRKREMDALHHALEQVKTGHGQVVAVMADPGVGKSRLFYEFKALSHSGCIALEAYSVSHGKASAYLPVTELLRAYFEITSDDDDRKRRERILGKVLGLDRTLEDTLPYLYSLFGISEAGDSLAQMDPQIRRRRAQEAIKRILLRESLNQPLIVIFEDLHWIDGETQALLNLLVDAIASARILLLVDYRPEYRHDWGGRTHYTQLRLDPLGRESAREMVSALLGNKPELEPLRRLIGDKTEGNPFFVEEMVQALFEQGVLIRNGYVKLMQPLSDIGIPSSIQAVLASRIDRLPPTEKELLQTLAVIGREFTLPLIRRMTGASEAEVEHMLSGLQSGEFIYEQPAFPDPEYSFKHALTQEVAYNSVLVERRKLLHERAGAAMEALYEGRLDDHLSELARNYQRSGNTVKALEYLQRAGQQAIARSSHAEGVALLTSALELLKTRPETPERMHQELAVQLGLGAALSAVKGLAAPEVGQAFDRASELCGLIGTTPQLFAVLVGLASFYTIRAEIGRGYELTQQLLTIAENERDAVLLAQAHGILGSTLWWMGEFVSAQEHLEHAISLYDSAHRKSPINIWGDPGVMSLSAAAVSQLCLGYPDQALERNREALTLAHNLAHPWSLNLALGVSGLVHFLLRDADRTLALANEANRLATEHGLQQLSGGQGAFRGGALIAMNQAEEGIAQVLQGLAALRVSGAILPETGALASLGDGYGKLGRVAEGLAAVADGLAACERTGARSYEAELYRIKGVLLLKQDHESASKVEEAEACFRHAIDVARRQQAKWWELHTTVSLTRLLMKQSRRDEARAMLAEVYNWFTEGFDTADLKEAKALLDELSC